MMKLNRNYGLLVAAFALLRPIRAHALEPVSEGQIKPVSRDTFQGDCNMAKPGSDAPNPRMVSGDLLFNSAMGDRQSDPQLAVGLGHVFVATNSGNYIYDKAGTFLAGAGISCFSGSTFPIDPKTFFDPVAKRYGMGRMEIQDKPWTARLAISKTGDPTQGWWQYNIDVTDGVDGGAIGFSGNWLVYLYPSNRGKRVLALNAAQVLQGQPATLYRFEEGDFDFGQPVFTHDADMGDQYFVGTAGDRFTVSKIHGPADAPTFDLVQETPHDGSYNFPPGAPQKDSAARAASGDPTAKIAILRKQSIWFAHDFESDLGGAEHSAVNWGQLGLQGELQQLGDIDDASGKVFHMQPTLGVNKNGDVLIGYQTSTASSFVSARYAYRLASDPPGSLRPAVSLQEGTDAAGDGAWGDYSGTSVDGDNLLDIWTLQSFASADGGRIHHTVVARHTFEDTTGGAGMAGAGGGGATSGGSGAGGFGGSGGPMGGAANQAGFGGTNGGSNSGGFSGSNSGTAATSGSNSAQPGSNAASGCGCRLSGEGQPQRVLVWTALLLCVAARRRRRPLRAPAN